MLDKTRSFNSITKPINGIITKSSINSKLLNEATYYTQVESNTSISEEVKVLFPRRISVEHIIELDNYYSLKLEYLPLHNLYHYVLNNDVNVGNKLVSPLLHALQTIHKVTTDIERDKLITYLQSMYIQKTSTEYNNYRRSAAFVDVPLKNYKSFEELWPEVVSRFFSEKALNYFIDMDQHPSWTMIHGDCCFSNILVEPDSGIVKFIDMRGSFGEIGIYGHRLYDYAKLLHSVDGCYEDIIYDQYTYTGLEERDEQVIFSENHVRDILKQQLFNKLPPELFQFVKAITGTIFIGMCHRQAPNIQHQRVMFIQGLRILNEVLYG